MPGSSSRDAAHGDGLRFFQAAAIASVVTLQKMSTCVLSWDVELLVDVSLLLHDGCACMTNLKVTRLVDL